MALSSVSAPWIPRQRCKELLAAQPGTQSAVARGMKRDRVSACAVLGGAWVAGHLRRQSRATSQRIRRSADHLRLEGGVSLQRFWEGFGVQPSWENRVLDAAEVPGAGRGWLARREVRKGDLLLSVSRSAGIEVDMDDIQGWEAELAVTLLRRLDDLGPAADPRLRQSDELQALWKDYAAELFPDVPAGAAFWPEDVLTTLGWPATVEQLLAYSQQIKESAQWVSETADVPLDRACWAVSAVITRSFADGEVRSMVPLADIFNHKPVGRADQVSQETSYAAWSISEDGERFEVRAIEDVAAGKEVRICYGEESAAEILAVHGILLDQNEADYLEIFESAEDVLAAVETLSGHPRRDRAELMEVALPPDDVLLRPTLTACEPLLRAIEVSLCEDEELPEPVQGELLLPDCSQERLRALRLQALLFLTQILRGGLRAMEDIPETSLGEEGPRNMASRYRGHIKDMLANLISSAEAEMSVELGA